MQLLDFYDTLSVAIEAAGKPAVYVCNHAVDQAVFMEFIREVNKRYGPAACTQLIDDTFDEGVVLFDNVEECVDFFSIWDNKIIFNSGLMAIMYDSHGNKVNASLAGCEYE